MIRRIFFIVFFLLLLLSFKDVVLANHGPASCPSAGHQFPNDCDVKQCDWNANLQQWSCITTGAQSYAGTSCVEATCSRQGRQSYCVISGGNCTAHVCESYTDTVSCTGGGGGGPSATPTPTPCVAPNAPTINRPPDGVFSPSPDGVTWSRPTNADYFSVKVNRDPFTTGNSCANANGTCINNSCTANGDRCRTNLTDNELASYTYTDNDKYRVTVNATNSACSPDQTSGWAENVGHACTPFSNDPAISNPTNNQVVDPGSYTVDWNTLANAGRYVLAVNDITSAVNNGTTPASLDCNADGSGTQFVNDRCLIINAASSTGNGTPSEKVVDSLVHNHYYNLKVQAFRCTDWVRSSAKSAVVRILACNALAAPASVVGNTVTNQVTWTTVSGADGYYVTVNDTTSNPAGVNCSSYPTSGSGAVGANDLCRKVVGGSSAATNFTFNVTHSYTIKVWAYNECREGPKTQRNITPGGSTPEGFACDILNNDSLHYQWDPAAGTTWLQVSESNALNADGSFVTANVYNSWTASTSVVIHDYPNGTPLQRGIPYYARIKRSAAGSQWIPVVPPPLPTCGPLPTPTLYPTIAIHGYLKRYQKSGPTCTNINPGGLTMSLTPQNSNGITTSCTKPTSDSYRCTVTFNNQTASPAPAQAFTLTATSTDGYAPGYMAGSSSAPNTCPANPDTGTNIINLDVINGPYDIGRDILFPTRGWIKLKAASFAGNTGFVLKDLPSTVTAFDSDDTCGRFFICPQAGAGTAGAPIPSGFPWSQTRNWGMTKTFSKQLTPTRFYDYIKARKDYVTSTLNTLQNGEINVINGSITIDENNKNRFTSLNNPTIILVNGNITFNVGLFNDTTNRSLAILSTGTIYFTDNNPGSNSNQEFKGIFVGENVNFDNSERAVKITGNLVSSNAMTFNRERDELTQPSLFIVHEPKYFDDLLGLLSISTYDWRQLQ